MVFAGLKSAFHYEASVENDIPKNQKHSGQSAFHWREFCQVE